MNETNNTVGTIQAKHAPDIIKVFGEQGKKIAQELAADPKATMLGLLFESWNNVSIR